MCKRPIKVSTESESLDNVRNFLSQIHLPRYDGDVNLFANQCVESLYNALQPVRREQNVCSNNRESEEVNRWLRLVNNNDDKGIWKAINWKGEISNNNETNRPSDEEFKTHFEQLLNPPGVALEADIDEQSVHTIPILDSSITEFEVQCVVNELKANKASGTDGLSPGIFKLLPATWISLITYLFNLVFIEGVYPENWCFSKLTVLFKKGNSSLCDNYRGISVMNTLAKIYDSILCKRLELWFSPFREQAGAQKGRSCEEQIATLRLAIDIAKHKKQKLFIVYVDFSKAYDLISRTKLIEILKGMGCSPRIMKAIMAIYSSTKNVLGNTIIVSILGLKQGSPMSCLLFIIYLNELVRLYRNQCPVDGFLDWLHCILFMDDTAIMATSKEKCIEKIKIMIDFCNRYGMKINFSKTMFMVINGTIQDRRCIEIDGNKIVHCDRYVYLGALILEDATFPKFIQEHAADRNKNLIKLYSFLFKNIDLPLKIKFRVMEACFFSSIFYSCETWFDHRMGKLNTLYLGGIN